MNLDLVTTLRRNHALEHATVALLAKRLRTKVGLVGRATAAGFYIYGEVPTEAVEQAASEGLARLQKGERKLAISPLCGTNLVVAAILAGIATLLVIRGKNRIRRLPQAILAAVVAIQAAQPIGIFAQRYLTTSTDLGDLRITRVTRRKNRRQSLHKVETTCNPKSL